MTKIETEQHRRIVAAERMSIELANLGEDMPEAGNAREAAVDDPHGRVEFAVTKVEIPASVAARIEAFYSAAKASLPGAA